MGLFIPGITMRRFGPVDWIREIINTGQLCMYPTIEPVMIWCGVHLYIIALSNNMVRCTFIYYYIK